MMFLHDDGPAPEANRSILFSKDDGCDDKQTKHNKLNDQSSNSDSLGRACHRSSHRHRAGSSALDQKRYHITGNNCLGKPFDSKKEHS